LPPLPLLPTIPIQIVSKQINTLFKPLFISRTNSLKPRGLEVAAHKVKDVDDVSVRVFCPVSGACWIVSLLVYMLPLIVRSMTLGICRRVL
jgi:hypothetical protein